MASPTLQCKSDRKVERFGWTFAPGDKVISKTTAQRLGSMRERNNRKNSSPDNEQQRDEPDLAFSLSLAKSVDPAPIDIVAFGKRLAEIIAKAVRASRKRHKPRTY